MFTGLVEAIGTVAHITQGERTLLEIDVPFTETLPIGASVAINGCCLTVLEQQDQRLHFEVGAPTLKTTTLGLLKEGQKINLERPMSADGRFGGHIVTGHVDSIGLIRSVSRLHELVEMTIALPAHFAPLVVSKGSITVDGVSLTVNEAGQMDPETFSVALLPYTAQQTILGSKKVGDPVNLEFDIIGKYVRRHLESYLQGPKSIDQPSIQEPRVTSV